MEKIEFKTVEELYKRVSPALYSKLKEIKRMGYTLVTEKDIWNYLVDNDWKNRTNLELYDLISDIMNADNYFMIGRANNNDYRNGLIRVYQARIWKTARTEQEIKENLCELKSGYNTDDLVGYWIFSDGIEKSEYEDLSGHEMNAKVGDHNGAKPSTIAADRYKPVECPHSY